MAKIKKNFFLFGSGGHAKACIDVIEASGLYKIAAVIYKKKKPTDPFFSKYKLINENKLVSNYITNENLRRVFSMHPLLVGGNPFTTTSIYTLILFLEKKWGIHYSMGGTGNVVKALEKLMLEEGV